MVSGEMDAYGKFSVALHGLELYTKHPTKKFGLETYTETMSLDPIEYLFVTFITILTINILLIVLLYVIRLS